MGPGKFSLPLKNFGVLKSLAPSTFSWPAKSPGTGQVLPQASPNPKSIHSPPLVSLSASLSPLFSSRAAANPSLAAANSQGPGQPGPCHRAARRPAAGAAPGHRAGPPRSGRRPGPQRSGRAAPGRRAPVAAPGRRSPAAPRRTTALRPCRTGPPLLGCIATAWMARGSSAARPVLAASLHPRCAGTSLGAPTRHSWPPCTATHLSASSILFLST